HAAEEEGLTVVSLAKREEEIFVPDRPLPIRLDKRSQALHLVQHIRDEAHRFAITYHRRLRGKGSLKSELDNVPGIGQVRRRELIKHFGSVAQLRDATLEDIAAAPSMNATAAQRLYEHLHGEDIEHKPEPIPS
ncbi:MAG: excinuclease ABC subunit C, partial [Armatimonadetes bacterium]|nr:excinuclease ABC subunit C [Armatimonadota bacterium]